MVITNLFYAIPVVGADLIFLLWGGFSIDDATLHRFYSLHFTLPFIILLVSLLHVFLLHEFGSSNPTGLSAALDNVPFSPYFVIKDTFLIIVVLIIVFFIIFISPDLLGHTDNYEKANFLVTPPHIVPEWYFLPLYAVLRSVTNKLLGIFLIALLIICLFIMSVLNKSALVKSALFKPWHAVWFWSFIIVCLLLGWIGSLPVMDPYLLIGQLSALAYFCLLFVLFPLGGFIETVVYTAYVHEHEVVRNHPSQFYIITHVQLNSIKYNILNLI